MAKYVLFVEGCEAVRLGLGPLLNQQLAGRNPKIIACDDLHRTIKRFLDELAAPRFPGLTPLLLIDLDGPAATAPAVLTAKNLTAHAAHTFWMVQEMEAWFLSQADSLHRVFGKAVTARLPNTPPTDVSKPGKVLADATKAVRAEPYDKVAHPPRLLPLLDLETLRRTFADVDRLVRMLAS